MPVGYYKDPEKTAATFVEIDGERWALPGDMARVEADGTITLLGRGSVSINSGGEKIYPEEVELALKSHPDVFDVVVVGVPDERWGERVVAVVKARPGATPDADELAAHARDDDRRLQGAAGDRRRRRDGALAVGQGRLPLGQGDRGRRRRQHQHHLTRAPPDPRWNATPDGDAAHPAPALRRGRRRGARLRRDLRAARRPPGPYGLPTYGLGLIGGASFLAGLVAQVSLARYADRGYTRLLLRVRARRRRRRDALVRPGHAPLGVHRRPGAPRPRIRGVHPRDPARRREPRGRPLGRGARTSRERRGRRVHRRAADRRAHRRGPRPARAVHRVRDRARDHVTGGRPPRGATRRAAGRQAGRADPPAPPGRPGRPVARCRAVPVDRRVRRDVGQVHERPRREHRGRRGDPRALRAPARSR